MSLKQGLAWFYFGKECSMFLLWFFFYTPIFFPDIDKDEEGNKTKKKRKYLNQN